MNYSNIWYKLTECRNRYVVMSYHFSDFSEKVSLKREVNLSFHFKLQLKGFSSWEWCGVCAELTSSKHGSEVEKHERRKSLRRAPQSAHMPLKHLNSSLSRYLDGDFWQTKDLLREHISRCDVFQHSR